MKYIISILIAFLMGAIPWSYIVGKATKHIDIRKHGSKNPGAGNIFHLVSWRAGIVALLGDMAKGYFALYFIYRLYHFSPALLTYFGLIAVFGHVFSPFLKFKGGKGAAITLGDFLFIMQIAIHSKTILILIYLAIPWIIVLLITHSQVVSLAAIFPLFPVFLWFITKNTNFVIATTVFMVMLEIFGIKSLKREWPIAYEKYVKKYFHRS